MPVHFYDRGDGMEKYGMYIQGNELKVFDTDIVTGKQIGRASCRERVSSPV